ncbi:hypothetical protein [Azospirillum sp.]|uniref:hypothetical protein n=1 Tax=Azospirillum sp. TaxID=34012 RepID=UPI0026218B99|nr:hypothetical protein [Azospirillum sp.]
MGCGVTGGRGSQPVPGDPEKAKPAGPKAKGAIAAAPCPIIWKSRAIMSAASGSAAVAAH